MYLSYSGYKTYDTCAFTYWNDYINKTKVEGVDDRLGAIYGLVVGKLFELFYNDKLWRRPHPQSYVTEMAESVLDQILKEETSPGRRGPGGVLLWRGMENATPRAYENRETLLADIRDAVSVGFRVIRQERLLGIQSAAEVKLDSTIGGHRLGGRADFIVHRVPPHDDDVIVDGKGTAYFNSDTKYVDKRQLVWYAALFRHINKKLPRKVAFLYWRALPHEAVEWHDVTNEEADALLQAVLGTIREIEERQARLGSETSFEKVREVFVPAEPSKDACRFCRYGIEAICPEGAKFKESEAKKAARNSSRRTLPQV